MKDKFNFFGLMLCITATLTMAVSCQKDEPEGPTSTYTKDYDDTSSSGINSYIYGQWMVNVYRLENNNPELIKKTNLIFKKDGTLLWEKALGSWSLIKKQITLCIPNTHDYSEDFYGFSGLCFLGTVDTLTNDKMFISALLIWDDDYPYKFDCTKQK